MEIEFNINRATAPNPSQPVARSSTPETPQDSASLGKTDALKSAINKVPLVRPEKVDAARAAISDTKYPPDAMLKAISSLIAEKIQ